MTGGKGNESQESICAWRVETFGNPVSNLRLASRANEEMAEALRAFASDPNSIMSAEEAADVIIVMCVVANNFGVKFDPFCEQDTCKSALTPGQFLVDANKFMAQLMDSLIRDDNDRTATHWIYGCYQKLCFFIYRMGLDPKVIVNQKMIINRSRKWVKDPDSSYSVRPEKLFEPDLNAIEKGALALYNSHRSSWGIADIEWKNLNLTMQDSFKKDAQKVLEAVIGVSLDAVGVDSSQGVGKVSFEGVGVGRLNDVRRYKARSCNIDARGGGQPR